MTRWNPNARQSQSLASATSSYASTGMTAARGTERLTITRAIVTAGSPERVATYAQPIKKNTSRARKAAPRPAAKAKPPAAQRPAPAAAPKAAPAAGPKTVPAAAPPALSGELERLRAELQRVNQEISRIARASRPDAARQTHLPEKQELLRQKAVLDAKIRAASKT